MVARSGSCGRLEHPGRPAVAAMRCRGAVALAPWLPDTEPVAQLAGRDLVVLHGTRDLTTSARASARFFARAAPLARRAACVQPRWSGHGMLLRAGLWHRLTAEFVRAVVDDAPFTDALTDARAARCIDCAPEGAA